MKKYLWLFAAIIAAFSLTFVVSSCGGGSGDNDVELTGVTITSDWNKIGVGQEFSVSAVAAPNNATFANADVSWTSSDDTKATVTKSATGNGLTATVKGIVPGTGVTITVSAKGQSDSMTIEVTEEKQEEPVIPQDPYFGKFNPATDKELPLKTDLGNGYGYWSLGGASGGMWWYEYLGYGEGEALYAYQYLVIEFKAPNTSGVNLRLSSGWLDTGRLEALLDNNAKDFFFDWKADWSLAPDTGNGDPEDNVFICFASWTADFESNIVKCYLTNSKPEGYTEIVED